MDTLKSPPVTHYLLKMMNGQPYLSLSIVHAPQVTPRHSKPRLSIDSLHIARLNETETEMLKFMNIHKAHYIGLD